MRGYTKNGNTKVNPMFRLKQRQMEAQLQAKLDAQKRMMSPMIPMIPGRVVVMRVLMLALALVSQALLKAPRTAFPWCCRGEPCRWWCSLLQHFLQTLGPMLFVQRIATMPIACDLLSL